MRQNAPSIMGLSIFIIVLLMSFSASATENNAESKAGAKYSDGYKAYQSTYFQEAIRYFEASYKLMPHTKTAYYLSRCFYDLYRPKEAREYAKHVLSDMPILGVTYRKNARKIVLWAQKVEDQSKLSIEFNVNADVAAPPRPELSLDPETDINPPLLPSFPKTLTPKKGLSQNNRCLDVAGGINKNKINVQLYDCNSSSAQKWKLTKQKEVRNINGKCLDVSGGVNKNATNVQIYTCNGSRSQKWIFTKMGELKNVMGRCLDISGGKNLNRLNVQIYACNGTVAQKWKLMKNRSILNNR